MWNFKKTLSILPTIFNTDGNVSRARVVDPYASQEFMINRFGWVSSDISLLLSADQANVQDNLLSRLQVLKSDSPNLSERDMLDTLVPRYIQSYAEREKFMEYVHKVHPDFFIDSVNSSDEDSVDTYNESKDVGTN